MRLPRPPSGLAGIVDGSNDGQWIFFGALIGLVAAAFDLAWTDVAMPGWARLSLAAGALLAVAASKPAAGG